MKSTLEIETKTRVEVDPQQMAEWFWAMSSEQQAMFFEGLYNVIQRDRPQTMVPSEEFCQMQWFWLSREIKKLPQPKQHRVANMIRAIAAPFFTYTVGFDWERWPMALPTYEPDEEATA